MPRCWRRSWPSRNGTICGSSASPTADGGRQPAAEGGSDALPRLQNVADPGGEADPDERAEVGRVYRRALELARGELEKHTRLAFRRTAVDGRLSADLAAELDMSPAGVRQAKSRVPRRLTPEGGDLLG